MPLTSPGAVAVVTTLLVEGAMSRADLARRTGLTPAAAPTQDIGMFHTSGVAGLPTETQFTGFTVT
jgi:hypothetical protein